MKKTNGLTLDQAKDLAFKAGFEGESQRMDCAQETFHGISTALGIKNPMIFKCLSAFEGGNAITTEGSCGAIVGALTAFSYFFGRTYDDWQEKKMVYESSYLGQELIKKFKVRHGGVICKDVLFHLFGRTFNLMERGEDYECYEKMGGHTRVCPKVVGWTAALAVELLWEKIPGDIDLSEVKGIFDLE